MKNKFVIILIVLIKIPNKCFTTLIFISVLDNIWRFFTPLYIIVREDNGVITYNWSYRRKSLNKRQLQAVAFRQGPSFGDRQQDHRMLFKRTTSAFRNIALLGWYFIVKPDYLSSVALTIHQ